MTGRHRRTLELGAALVAYAGLLLVSIAFVALAMMWLLLHLNWMLIRQVL